MAHPHPDQAPTPGWPTHKYLPDRPRTVREVVQDAMSALIPPRTLAGVDQVDADLWTGPVVNPEPPAVIPEDLAKVIAARLCGVDFTPSEVRLHAWPDGARVVLLVITWGPVTDEHRRREARYVIDLGEPT